MPRKYVLSWSKAHKRWHKTIEGKKYYFQKAKSKADIEAYRASVEDYEALVKRQLRRAANKTRQPLPNSTPLGVEYLTNTGTNKPLTKTNIYSFPKTSIAGLAERYFEYELARVQSGQITLLRLRNISNETSYFINTFIKKEGQLPNSNRLLNGNKYTNYFRHLTNRLSPTKRHPRALSVTTATHYLRSARRFFYWCWRNEFIDDLPRNLEDPNISFKKLGAKHRQNLQQQIEIFSVEDIRKMLAQCPSSKARYKIKLYILLGLNCGFTPVDLATLRVRHLVFDESGNIPQYIERHRTKTNVFGRWKLWDETKAILVRALNDKLNADGDLLFHTQRGTPLEYKRLSVPVSGERYTHTKLIQSAVVGAQFKTIKRNAFPETGHKLTFKYLRKTTATMINNLDMNNTTRIAQTFLAHNKNSVAEQSYIQPDFTSLDEALLEIEKVLCP